MIGRIKSKRADEKYGDDDFIEKLKNEMRDYKYDEEYDRYQETLGAELNYERVFATYHNGPTNNDKWIKKYTVQDLAAHTRKKNAKRGNPSKLAQ